MSRREPDYRSFAQLRAQESARSYLVHCMDRDSDVVVLAPHGGGIEFVTMALARSIAGDEHSFYCFEGKLKTGNARLHIPSTDFDEPRAVRMLARAAYAVCIHGAAERDEAWTMVGGRDERLAAAIASELSNAGFALKECDVPRAGREPANLCNRTARNMGVQLELSALLRSRMRDDPSLQSEYAAAVRRALRAVTAH